MSARLTFDGLAAFRAALRQLPDDLKAEGESLVQSTAELAVADIQAGYAAHTITGDLASHVSTTAVYGNTVGARYLVRSTAKHAWLYENGSQARLYYTKKGVKHYTGRMPRPPIPVFVPAMRRARRRLDTQLFALLQRHGLRVSGAAA